MTNIRFKCQVIAYYLYYRYLRFKKRGTFNQWQEKQLKCFKRKILSRSPYYSSIRDCRFNEMPLMNKTKHMANFNDINTVGMDLDGAMAVALESESTQDYSKEYNQYSVGLSSGTSGSRGMFVTSEAERARWVGYIFARIVGNISGRHRIALLLRVNNNLYSSVLSRRVSFQFYDLHRDTASIIDDLNTFKPTVLVGPAQALTLLAKAQGRSLVISPKKVISVAEVLEKDDKQLISAAFKQTVHEMYQCTEGFLAHTCVAGNLHLNEDLVHIGKEWLDKDSRRFVPIVTDFCRRTQPIVNYRLDDILIENTTPCSCGSVFTRLEKIEGRCDDMLRFKRGDGSHINIFPDYMRRAIITSTNRLVAYRVIQTAFNSLSVQVEPFDNQIKEAITDSINKMLAGFNVASVNLNFSALSIDPIHQKQRRIISLIKTMEKAC